MPAMSSETRLVDFDACACLFEWSARTRRLASSCCSLPPRPSQRSTLLRQPVALLVPVFSALSSDGSTTHVSRRIASSAPADEPVVHPRAVVGDQEAVHPRRINTTARTQPKPAVNEPKQDVARRRTTHASSSSAGRRPGWTEGGKEDDSAAREHPRRTSTRRRWRRPVRRRSQPGCWAVQW